METKTYKGFLSLDDFGKSTDVLLLSSLDEPLLKVLEEDIACKKVTARYWVTDRKTTKEEAIEYFFTHSFW